MRLPSGLNATLVTMSVCPLRERTSWPVAASHTFTVLSSLPLTMRLPSALNATLVTLADVSLEARGPPGRCPRPTPSPSVSQLPLTMRLPSALIRHAVDAVAVCPLRVRTSWPVSASHTFTVLSRAPPLTMRLPSGLNATLRDAAGVSLEGEELPGPLSASHTFTVTVITLPLTMRLPSALNATLLTWLVCPLRVRSFLARVRVPHLHRLVPAAADDAFAVGADTPRC